MNVGKYLFFSFFYLILTFDIKAQDKDPDLDWLCDSVMAAVNESSKEKLRALVPSYKDLKVLYDTNDVDMMMYQIGVRQKELEYWTSRDMKRLVKSAKSNRVSLAKLKSVEYDYPILQNEEGRRFTHVQAKCTLQTKSFIVHFVLIELNNEWFYGEGLRMEKIEIPVEQKPDYDLIDAEREKRIESRRRRIEKQEREQERQVLREQKEKERVEKERLKEEERKRKEEEQAKKEEQKRLEEERKLAEQKEKERLKEQEKKRKEEEQAKKEEEQRLLEEKKKAEKKEKERLKKEEKKKKEEERAKKEEEKRLLEEKKKEEKKEKERLKKEELKRKKEEKKEKERLKKEELKQKKEEKRRLEKKKKEEKKKKGS